jgi:hypothetical protein
MSVTPVLTETIYSLAGSSTLGPFNTVFPYNASGDVTVWLDVGDGIAELLAQGSDYTLTASNPTLTNGGSVTLAAYLLTTATWAAGAQVALVRATPRSQPSTFGEATGFSPQASEQALDNVERQVQELTAQAQRTLQVEFGGDAPVIPLVDSSLWGIDAAGTFLNFVYGAEPNKLIGTDATGALTLWGLSPSDVLPQDNVWTGINNYVGPEAAGARVEIDRGTPPTFNFGVPSFPAVAISNAVWANTAGGQITFTVPSDLRAVLSAGQDVYASGSSSTGGLGYGFNGTFEVVSVGPNTVVVSYVLPSSPGTYSSGGMLAPGGTHAAFVVQNADTTNYSYNQISASTVFSFKWSGNGPVNAASELSNAYNWGLQSTMTKTGDGSGHAFTGTVTVGSVGPGGYNEGGAFEALATNIGSSRGFLALFEGLADDGGYPTRIYGSISRLKVSNTGAAQTTLNYLATSEGSKPVGAAFELNQAGSGGWTTGIDLTGLGGTVTSFASGNAFAVPNGASFAYKNASGALVPAFTVNNANVTAVFAPAAGGSIGLYSSAFVEDLAAGNSAGGVMIGAPTYGFLGVGKLNAASDLCINGVSQGPGAATEKVVAAPVAPASTTAYTMQGLAGAITPTRNGKMLVSISGTIVSSSGAINDGIRYQISYGGGAAPVNGAAATGSQAGAVQSYTAPVAVTAADVNVPFCITAVIIGLSVGTAYWLDLIAESVTAGSSYGLAGVSVSAIEF